MSGSLLNIGTSALLANQQVLRTTGNNIANVNTAGYSRQKVQLNALDGLYSGSGYYGRGVEAATVLRSHSDMLTRQIALTGSIAAADDKRLEQLKKLGDLFQGGTTGLGAAVNDMLNAFSDVANTPTDLTARTIVLARTDETAARFRSASQNLDNLRASLQLELKANVRSVNQLASQIADSNREIRNQQGNGQAPNDLLDKRDELIRQLNMLVQTSSIPAEDGSINIFVASSQPLVLGTSAANVTLTPDAFGDPNTSKLTINRAGQSVMLDEASLGGGALAGQLRFQNTDLADAGNLLGRMGLALGTVLNQQHSLGLDLNGAPAGNLMTLGPIPDGRPALANTGSATIQVAVQTTPVSGATALAAADYEVQFTAAATGTVKRISDGQVTAFTSVPIQIDGLTLQVGGAAAAGDRFMVTPYRQVAAGMGVAFSSPRGLAVASPVVPSAGVANQGSLTLQTLIPQQANANLTQTVTLTFTGAGSFDVAGTGTGNPTGVAFVPGLPISYNGWALTLKGTPQVGDTYTVRANAYPAIDAGNAQAMLALRDLPLFDGAATTDGYASLMAEVGVRVQSAGFASAVSQSIASNATADQAALAGVNLDEEAARMLQFQQAYQASAKILQVSQTLFDSLLQNLAR
ncbi:MAG: flagellar hook-associated protein FlgK [Betaproteobacteria bacterium]